MIRVVGRNQITKGLEDACARWLPSVLATLHPELSMPASRRLPDPEAFVDSDDLPALVFSSPGLDNQPSRDGGGVYAATWTGVVTIYVRGDDYESTADLVGAFTECIRVAVLQDGDLDGLASDVVWAGEAYEPIARQSERTLSAGSVQFSVHVHDVMALPLQPLRAPSPPAPLFDDVPLTSFEADVDLVDDHPAL